MEIAAETGATIDPAEIAKFEAIAAEWWDPDGKYKPLHMRSVALSPAGGRWMGWRWSMSAQAAV